MLTYKNTNYDTAENETWLDVCARNNLAGVLAVRVGGLTQNLHTPCRGDAVALTYEDEEGRAVYERSAIFLFLMAVEALIPGTRVRVENSLGGGVFITFRGAAPGAALLKRLEEEMHRLSGEALPFTLSVLSKDDAKALFEANGRPDVAQVLTWRQSDTFRVFECGGIRDYFYGEMAADTSAVGVFSLKAAEGGLVLLLPDAANPVRPAAYTHMTKLLDAFRESNSWQRILNVENACDLNTLIENGGFREFIRVNEALMDMRINRIAEEIVRRRSRLVLIAGPSSSGKTTFTNRLRIALRVQGLKPVQLSMDNYYLDADRCPLDSEGKPDFECPESLDIPLMNKQLSQMLKGRSVDMPIFDFGTHARSEQVQKVTLDADSPLLMEGIHGLNDSITRSIPANKKFKIYISALTNLNLDDHNRIRSTDARLVRRLVRDAAFRGTPVEKTLEMWSSVRRGEDSYIYPYQETADIIINSALVYELPIMKKYIYDKLLAVTPDKPYYDSARRIVKFLNYLSSADCEDEIPLNSLLREFVGGSCFYREEEG